MTSSDSGTGYENGSGGRALFELHQSSHQLRYEREGLTPETLKASHATQK